jgi:hypothetical protein
MVGSAVFYAIVFSIPFYARIIVSLLNPLAVDASGATLAGHYRRWQVGALTGRVAGVQTHSSTHTNPVYGTVQTSTGTQQVVTGIRTSTSTHTTLLLVDPAGQQHTFTLTNFGLEVFNGQIASLCVATRGRKNVTIAALNHSTRRQFTRPQDLYKIVHPRGVLLGFWISFAVLLAGLVAFALGFAFFFVFLGIFLISGIISGVTSRRQVRRFTSSGIDPLWTITAAAAAG